MAKGGARPGAGRKPHPKKGIVIGMDGARREMPAPLSPVEIGFLLEPPADLDVSAQDVWRKWAGYAVGERTLTEATAAGFAELCQQSVDLKRVHDTIQKFGAGTKEAEPYWRTYLKLAQRFDNSLARFKLTAFGKPAVSDKPKAAANPWASVAAK